MPALYIVTGAAQGIGAVIIEKLLQQGHLVIGIDQQSDLGKWKFYQQYQEIYTQNFVYITHDIYHTESLIKLIEQSKFRHLPITGLINAAGILHIGSLLNSNLQQWQHNLNSNLLGPILLSQWVAKEMIKNKEGVIVTISSNAALIPRINMGLYATTKAALSHCFKNLALELAPYGIRCNLVLPGSTFTAMQKQLWTDDRPPKSVIGGDLAQYRTGIPLQRIAEPEDIANAVLFLLSDQARQITMHELVVDGGATLGV